MTYLRTYLLTWIGARDTCVSKKSHWTLINLNHSVCGCLETLYVGKTNMLQQKRNPKVMCSMLLLQLVTSLLVICPSYWNVNMNVNYFCNYCGNELIWNWTILAINVEMSEYEYEPNMEMGEDEIELFLHLMWKWVRWNWTRTWMKLFLQLMLSVWWMVDDLTILRKLTFSYFLGIRPPPTTLTKIADKKLIEHDSCWLHLSENTLHPMVLVHVCPVTPTD